MKRVIVVALFCLAACDAEPGLNNKQRAEVTNIADNIAQARDEDGDARLSSLEDRVSDIDNR